MEKPYSSVPFLFIPFRLRNHSVITAVVVIESILVLAALGSASVLVYPHIAEIPYAGLFIVILLLQGLWLDRFYILGHEATHKKLAPDSSVMNTLLGSFILLPLAVPLRIYRKIHNFHHAFNRKNFHTAALDTYCAAGKKNRFLTVYFYCLWYLGVFFGGLFLHSLISIVLFLFLPVSIASKISPAFNGWNGKDRIISWLQFLAGIAFHAAFIYLFELQNWLLFFGYPLIAFAWIWSLFVYIFHYRMGYGGDVRKNARSLRRHFLLSWVLLNFHNHARHHYNPNGAWYELKDEEEPAAPSAENRLTFFRAILNQLKGPAVVFKNDNT